MRFALYHLALYLTAFYYGLKDLMSLVRRCVS